MKLAQSPENVDINFIIVTHSVSTGELEQFVMKELDLSLPTNVKCHGDTQRDVYAAYGLGEIGITSVINRNVLSQLGELKKEGITNRLTRGTRCALDKRPWEGTYSERADGRRTEGLRSIKTTRSNTLTSEKIQQM